jgi:hypothetical protein
MKLIIQHWANLPNSPHLHPMKTKPKPIFPSIAGFFRQIQQRTSVALMASVISVCALGVSWYQAKLARQQQLASVWPYVSINGYGSANSKQQVWGVKVMNNGLGPAIIERVEMQLDGKPIPNEVFMDSVYAQNIRLDSVKSLDYAFDELAHGTVLSAGAKVDWMKFEHQFNGTPPKETTSQRFLPKLSLSIYYKSLYDERWVSCFNCPDTGEDEVRKLD